VLQPGFLLGELDPINCQLIQITRHLAESGQVSAVTLVPCDMPHRRPVAGLASRVEMARVAVREPGDILVLPRGVSSLQEYLLSCQARAMEGNCGTAQVLIFTAVDLAALADQPGMGGQLNGCDILIIPCPGIDAGALAQSVTAMGANARISDRTYDPSGDGVIRSMAGHFEDPLAYVPLDVIVYIALNGLYVPDYAAGVKNMINPRRFAHTLGVRDTAVRLARMHGAPMIRSAVAGLLHDCAKEMKLEAMRAAVGNRAEAGAEVLASGALLHGLAGAAVAQTAFGITDSAILAAIACHTVGRAGMTPLDLCLFVADAIEPTRGDYPGLAEIRALARTDLRRAALLSMECTRAFVLEKGEPYSASTLDAMRDLAKPV
jgi:predicted HD superfamily hydrolase involved in NAD metabolism